MNDEAKVDADFLIECEEERNRISELIFAAKAATIGATRSREERDGILRSMAQESVHEAEILIAERMKIPVRMDWSR